MHNAALAAIQKQQPHLDYVYVPLSVKPADLAVAMAGFTAIGLVGFNITLPHKQAILPFLSRTSAIAKIVGAVNTVWQVEDGWEGTNTDLQGFLAPLSQYERDWKQSTALILGSGGAARAVAVACAQLGCAEIGVIGRNQFKLEQFQQSWQHHWTKSTLQVYPWETLPQLLPRAGLLVNSTPVGMHPHVDQSPLTKTELEGLPADAIIYDLIYIPRPTQFLVQAKQRGLVAIDGLEMLVQQGAAALEIWLKQPVPVAIMRQAAEDYLGLR